MKIYPEIGMKFHPQMGDESHLQIGYETHPQIRFNQIFSYHLDSNGREQILCWVTVK